MEIFSCTGIEAEGCNMNIATAAVGDANVYMQCNSKVCLLIAHFSLLFVYSQITCTMVALWHHLRRARRSKFRRYGLLNNHIIPDATLCYHINCLFPVEDEQRLRTHNVYVIFCIRCYFADVRVRVVQVSTLKRISHIEIGMLQLGQQ